MPIVESILLEIEKSPTIEQENILSILEEVLLFGSHVGRISQEVMESRFSKGKVCPYCGEDSIICTDSHKSYNKFARDLSLDHKRIPSGKHKEGIYHIQHINSIHSKL